MNKDCDHAHVFQVNRVGARDKVVWYTAYLLYTNGVYSTRNLQVTAQKHYSNSMELKMTCRETRHESLSQTSHFNNLMVILIVFMVLF